MCALFILRIWLLRVEQKATISPELLAWLKDMTESSRRVDEKLTQNMDMFHKRLDHAADALNKVSHSIGEFTAIGRSMQELQEFLQSPKLRGNLGEQVLQELLRQTLPPDMFTLQYSFSSGSRVDAIVKTTQGMVPIDSKFPMSSFDLMYATVDEKERITHRKSFIQDVKKHIQAIAGKYIRPSEGTLDYALMYIPSESVYYEIIREPSLFDEGTRQRVIPVSPMSFYAYVKVILVSHEGARIQSQAKEILSGLREIQQMFSQTESAMTTLHKHLGNAYHQSSQASHALSQLGSKIATTSSLSLPEVTLPSEKAP